MSATSDEAKDVKTKKGKKQSNEKQSDKKQPNETLPPLAQGEGGVDVRPSPSISSAYVPDQLVPRELAFSSTLQGTPTNEMQRISLRTIAKATVDRVTGKGEIKEGRITFSIADFIETSKNLRKNSPKKLFQYGVSQLTKINPYKAVPPTSRADVHNEVQFSLSSYMEIRGLKDRKEAYRQVREDCKTLLSISAEWTEVWGKDSPRTFKMMNYVYKAELDNNGVITLAFTPDLAVYLVNEAFEMKLPDLFYRLDDKKNPNSSPLLFKLAVQKRQTRGEKTEDTHKITTLLDSATFIPSWQDASIRRQAKARIIKPLLRDLRALAPLITYELYDGTDTLIPKDREENIPFDAFLKSKIKVFWNEYPLPQRENASKELQSNKGKKQEKK